MHQKFIDYLDGDFKLYRKESSLTKSSLVIDKWTKTWDYILRKIRIDSLNCRKIGDERKKFIVYFFGFCKLMPCVKILLAM